MIFTLVGNKEVVVNSTPKERCFLSPSSRKSHVLLIAIGNYAKTECNYSLH